MPEWLNGPVLKTGIPETVSEVRILLPPPIYTQRIFRLAPPAAAG